jgi:hypothetical protein
MTVNYGTIYVTIHPGLSEDQLTSTVITAVENHVPRHHHRNEILNQCLALTRMCVPPLEVIWNMRDYEYTYHLSTVNTGSMSSESL